MTSSDSPSSIPGVLSWRARLTPEAIGFNEQNASGDWCGTSWLHIWDEVRRVAQFLRGNGLKRGDRFVIAAKPSRKWETLNLGVLAAGGTVVGLDPHASAGYAHEVICRSGARWLAVDEHEQLSAFETAGLDRHETVVLDPSAHSDGWHAWRDLVRHRAVTQPLPLISADDPATLIFTSGTTGQPKAIQYTHRQLLVACDAILEAFPQLKEGDRTICWLPLAHLFQRMMNLVAIARGISVFFVNDPRLVMEAAAKVHPAVFFGVPRFYEKLYEGIQDQLKSLPMWQQRLIDCGVRDGMDVRLDNGPRSGSTSLTGASSWKRMRLVVLDRIVLRKIREVMGTDLRFLITGSAATPKHILEFFHAIGLPLLETYGVSENTIPMAVNRPDDFRIGSVGKPLHPNDVLIDESGEVLVRGPGVSRGYEGDALRSAQWTDGLYRTGDLGRFDADGYLHLTGRKSDLIKTSTGRRLTPAAIEATYLKSALFDQLVVFGDNRPYLVALVVPNRERLASVLAESETDYDPGSPAFVRHPAVTRLLSMELETLGNELRPYEQIRRFAALAEPLSISRGELTSTLKLRRKFIAESYAATIEQLSAEQAPVTDASGISRSAYQVPA